MTSALVLGGCVETKRDLGPCIGAFDDGDECLRYQVSLDNLIFGAVLSETVVAPAWVVIAGWKCPVAKRTSTEARRC